jgi:hypothetical protein
MTVSAIVSTARQLRSIVSAQVESFTRRHLIDDDPYPHAGPIGDTRYSRIRRTIQKQRLAIQEQEEATEALEGAVRAIVLAEMAKADRRQRVTI